MTYKSIPDEFKNRVLRTKFSGYSTTYEHIRKVAALTEETEIDVIYENGRAVVVLVFETQEDCLAFKLKHGDKYA